MMTIELTPEQYAHFLRDEARKSAPTCESCQGPKGDNVEARDMGNPLICDPCMNEALDENAHWDGICESGCPHC